MSRVAVVYCCPVPSQGEEHFRYAERFVASFIQCQPLYDHQLVVVANGGSPSPSMEVLFSNIPTFTGFFERHDNKGWDIGAFMDCARTIDNEVIVFFGGNAYLKGPAWLRRMMHAYDQHGPHLYGALASIIATPHIRTTGFWMPRALFNRYPTRVTDHQQRYDFEHRTNNLTDWCEAQGHSALMVTWTGVYTKQYWGRVPNAFGCGDHSECMVGDRVSDLICPVK